MRFFFVNTRNSSAYYYLTLHYITLLKQYLHFSETFPRHFRVNVVRISFACRSHVVRITNSYYNVMHIVSMF